MIDTLILTVHITVALALIIIVLFQHGKGASMGSAFGGSSQTLFGSRGPATALAKITTGAAVIFMITSITLSVLSREASEKSVVSDSEAQLELPVDLPDKTPATSASQSPGPSAVVNQSEPKPEQSSSSAPTGPLEADPNAGQSN